MSRSDSAGRGCGCPGNGEASFPRRRLQGPRSPSGGASVAATPRSPGTSTAPNAWLQLPEKERGPQRARPIESNDPVLRSGVRPGLPGLRGQPARPASRRRVPGRKRWSRGPISVTLAHLASLHTSAVVNERDQPRAHRPSMGRRPGFGRCSIVLAFYQRVGQPARQDRASSIRIAIRLGV